MANDANKKTYFSSIDKIEQNSLLTNVHKDKISLYLWEEGQEEDDLQEFQLDSYDVNQDKMNLSFSGKILSRLLGTSLAGKNVYLKLTYQKVQYFTYGDLTHNKSTNLHDFSPKHAFYKGQKRTNYRLMSDAQTRIQVKLDSNVFECFDISASGISLLIPENAPHGFHLNQIFERSAIRLSKQDFSINKIEVKGIFSNKEREHVKKGYIQIGMAFSSIEKSVEEALFLAINSEARSAEMRKKFSKKQN